MKIETYKSLRQTVQKFREGYFSFIIIESKGGLGKSTIVTDVLSESQTYLYTGHVTPYSLFKSAKNNPAKTLIFDDVDTLLKSKDNVALLKQICDTKDSKRVTWHTTRGMEEQTEKFTSHHKAVLLSNDVEHHNKDLQALHDRAISFKFQPNKKEIVDKADTFIEDKDLLQWILKADNIVDNLSLRKIIQAEQMKKAGLSWEKILSKTKKEIILAKKLAKESKTKKEAIKRFKEETGKSRRTFYNYLNT